MITVSTQESKNYYIQYNIFDKSITINYAQILLLRKYTSVDFAILFVLSALLTNLMYRLNKKKYRN